MKKNILIIAILVSGHFSNSMIVSTKITTTYKNLKPLLSYINIKNYPTEIKINLLNDLNKIDTVQACDILCNRLINNHQPLSKLEKLTLISDLLGRNDLTLPYKDALRVIYDKVWYSNIAFDDYAMTSNHNPFFYDQKTILHIATEHNNDTLFQLIIKHTPFDFIDKRDKKNNTALYIAAKRLRPLYVEGLLTRSACENSSNGEDGKKPLSIALHSFCENFSLTELNTLLSIINMLCQAGASPTKEDIDYIHKKLDFLLYDRQRTLYNENAKLIDVYTKIEKVLTNP